MNKWKECILTFWAAVQKIAKEAWAELQKAWATLVAALQSLVTAFCRDVKLLVAEGKQAAVALGNKVTRLFRLWFS